jgi:hypothetical protein
LMQGGRSIIELSVRVAYRFISKTPWRHEDGPA